MDWILVLVTLLSDGQYKVTTEKAFDYYPSCQISAEGRQLFLTAEGIHHKQYVCIAKNPMENNNERQDSISN